MQVISEAHYNKTPDEKKTKFKLRVLIKGKRLNSCFLTPQFQLLPHVHYNLKHKYTGITVSWS